MKKVLACVLTIALLLAVSVGVAAVGVTLDANGAAVTPFADVAGKSLTEAVARLNAQGIALGTETSEFKPSDSLTYAAMLTFLGRAHGVEVDNSKGGAGIRADGWSAGYVQWALDNGLVTDIGQYDTMQKAEVNTVLENYNETFGKSLPTYSASLHEPATRGSFAILLAAGVAVDATPVVSVTGGSITGHYSPDGEVAIYKGIPFAAAPVGDLRWKEPQPVVPWDGVRDCVTWSASAIQNAQAPFMMWTTEFIIEDTGYSEDCLYLNVWNKDDDATGKPVIVYIHGGALTSGGSSCEVYDGEYIAEQGAVFVNINYRVGALGFLATSELSAESPNGVSGNYGLLDQIAALEWVQENIEQFGGDPGNVTIMGQSAGAWSVNALIRSPLAAGLFHKALSESYSDITDQVPTLTEAEKAGEEAFGGKSLAQLRAMSAEEVLATQFSTSFNTDGYALTADPAEAYLTGEANDVALMTGMVTGDALLFGLIPFGAPDSVEAYETVAVAAFGEDVLELYPATDEDFLDVYNQLIYDVMMAQMNLVSQARAASYESPTYVYLFDHTMPGLDGGAFGAFHTADVPYFLHVFSNHRADLWQQEDFDLGKTMSSYLLNFAKTGDPNGGGLVQWDANSGDGSFFLLDTTCEAQQLSEEKTEFFAALYAPILS